MAIIYKLCSIVTGMGAKAGWLCYLSPQTQKYVYKGAAGSLLFLKPDSSSKK